MQEDLTLPPLEIPRVVRALDRMLDRLARPTIDCGGRTWRSFHLLGLIGIAAGIAQVAMLLSARSLPIWPALPLMIVIAVAAFLGSAIAESFLARRERLTYYHHLLAILIAMPLALRLFGLPLLPYLDAAILGIGTTLAFCRFGCTMAGCCHGRPARWGVRYGDAHVARGFPRALAYGRLVPIQLIEATVVAAILAGSSLLFVNGAPYGATLANFLVLYAVARTWVETGRGDSKRKFAGGLSEAQWTSLGIAFVVVIAELMRLLPASRAHAALLVVSTVALLIGKRLPALNTRETNELASLIDDISRARGAQEIAPATTGTGLCVSGGAIASAAGTIYTLSRELRAPSYDEAAAFARLAQLLRHPDQSAEIVHGPTATHVLFHRPRITPPPRREWSIPPTHAARRPQQELPLLFPRRSTDVGASHE
jgi:hypothetical protein